MKSMRYYTLFFIFLILLKHADAQHKQTIRGTVRDADSRATLPGAAVVILGDTAGMLGGSTDLDGRFIIENVPVGRRSLRVTFMGFEPIVMNDVIVNSAREVVLNIEMHESVVSMSEFEVVATAVQGEAINEMAIISARQFSVDETERYAGSRGDPARMASNFAGVSGADDSRNDIVIRGNSPMGVLWRFEGIDIPNPNHFSIAGTQGGPTGIINNKYLSNSDFYTGAFPAEFGNSLAGVFDLRMRPGNNSKHEFTGQFGIFGTELMAEGPISRKSGSSYLLNYRYSTITLFNRLGIDIGTSSKLHYQDAAFKLNFQGKKGGVFSLFGIGGESDIDIVISDQKPEEREIYGQQDRDQHFGTAMGVAGITYTKSIANSSYVRATVAQTFEQQRALHQYIYYSRDSTGKYLLDGEGYYRNDSLVDVLRYLFRQQKQAVSLYLNTKWNAKNTTKIGMLTDVITVNYQDSTYSLGSKYNWLTRFRARGTSAFIQPYAQWRFKPTERHTLHAGLHAQYFTLNSSGSWFEPRAGFQFNPDGKQQLSLGAGIHSQLQPMYIYYYRQMTTDSSFVQHNRNIGMTKSLHLVGSYSRSLLKSMRVKTEIYYQSLWNVPVEKRSSSFSLLNQGVGFSRFFPDTLVNTGTGTNYGAELTIEQFFSKQFFFMVTGSYYNSQYKASDGRVRNTDFNGKYAFNFLATKEFELRGKDMIGVGTKITYAGNKWYGPVDTLASRLASEVIFADNGRNSKQFKPYFRWDIRLNYKINQKRVAHEIAFDLVNVLGTKNILKLSYAPDLENPAAEPIKEEYQLGFLPIFYYRIDF